MNEKLDAEITKADKLEIENKKLSSRVASFQRERDTLLQERDTLRETVDELRCSTITTGALLCAFYENHFVTHINPLNAMDTLSCQMIFIFQHPQKMSLIFIIEVRTLPFDTKRRHGVQREHIVIF
jgi:hypothetical protein